MNRRLILLLPLLLFAGLLIFMAGNLGKPQEAVVRSHMVGKPVADFALEGVAGAPGLAASDLASGKPVLVNIFASWCLPCAVEAPQLQALKDKGATLHGIAVRDTPEKVAAFLARHGNPFQRIGNDDGGRMLIAFGASGVPETYVVDGEGIIRHQHLGEIRPEHVPELLAELEKAR
ncbi:redoxin domain-containing protein [Sandaracinobacter sp. RS1-74]|uniref:redoxin domain-containing protein n=1 Tax=Sandaracinobacteroides sayramensis TaxID=2913411 RepID=UPI001ED9C92A|nr:redoxin domain-containing protein [Sandaracinobacteroides sayramensis]MCG2841353.1 redoxin domain-containing protein [Sandaracinobacteroides sayramensis]